MRERANCNTIADIVIKSFRLGKLRRNCALLPAMLYTFLPLIETEYFLQSTSTLKLTQCSQLNMKMNKNTQPE